MNSPNEFLARILLCWLAYFKTGFTGIIIIVNKFNIEKIYTNLVGKFFVSIIGIMLDTLV